MVVSLTRLTGNVLWRWKELEQEAFKKLKKLFTIKLILAQFDYDRETVIKCDLLGYTTGEILSQYNDKGFLRLYIYFSKKNSPAEYNYEIHNKELLTIIQCLEKWDAEL